MVMTRRASALFVVASLTFLAGCAATYRTSYEAGVAADVSRGWRVADVRVDVPEELSVSEARTYVPAADIVWREDPPGNRRAQVAVIVQAAARQGAASLKGPRPVVLDITVTRFHALTFEAEQLLSNAGVHNIDFTIQVVDAATGTILAGPEDIEAALPALSGVPMVQARIAGQTQKSQITAHLSTTIAAWLGVGPDPRRTFRRLGD